MNEELEPYNDEEIDKWLDESWHIEVEGNRVNFYNCDDDWYEYMTPRTIHVLCRRLIDAATEAGMAVTNNSVLTTKGDEL